MYKNYMICMTACCVQVPVLCQANLKRGLIPPGSLVRWRGMVQDMLETQFYQSALLERHPDGDVVLICLFLLIASSGVFQAPWSAPL